MSRIPFVAAVVGALLIGGATTGGTHASWVSSTALPINKVTSGIMDFSAPSPTSTTNLSAGGASSTNLEVLVKDTSSSTAKNLRQAVRVTGVAKSPAPSDTLTLSQLRVDVVKKSGSCASTVPTASAVGYTTSAFQTTGPATLPAAQSYTLCIRLAAATGATSASGTLSIQLTGRQQTAGGANTGWTTAHSVDVPVVVVGDSLKCPSASSLIGTKNQVPLSWTNPAGTTQTVVQFKTSSGGSFGTAPGGSSPINTPSTSYLMTHTGGNNDVYTYFFRVSFVGTGTTSNTVSITRNGSNGNGNMTCAE